MRLITFVCCAFAPLSGCGEPSTSHDALVPQLHEPPPFVDDSSPYSMDVTVSGRVQEDADTPAANALVTIYEEYAGWSGGWRVLSQTRTDEQGRFSARIPLVGDGAPVLEVHGRAAFAVLRQPLSLSTGGSVHLGEMVLEPFYVLEGIVEWEPDFEPEGRRNWAQILEPETLSVIRGSKIDASGQFRMEGVAPRDVTLRVFSDDKDRKRVSWDRDWSIPAQDPRNHVVLSLHDESLDLAVDDELTPGGRGRGSIGTAEEAYRGKLAGRVRDRSGQPLRGLLVMAIPTTGWRSAEISEACVVTDAGGRFSIPAHPAGVTRLWIESAGETTSVVFEPLTTGRLRKKSSGVFVPPSPNMEVVLAAARVHLPTEAAGVLGPDEESRETVALRYSARSLGAWKETSASVAARRLSSKPSKLRIEPEGHLPRVNSKVGLIKGLTLDLADEVPRALVISGGEAPLAGVRVHLDQHQPMRGRSPSTTSLGVTELPVNDRNEASLAGRAPANAIYDVHVTAAGHAARSFTWARSGRTEVSLEPLRHRVSFEGVKRDEVLFVGHSGTKRPLHVLHGTADPEVFREVALADGSYDLALIDTAGTVVAGQSLELTQSTGKPSITVGVRDDRRVQALLRLPEPIEQEGKASAWNAALTRTMPAFGSIGAAAYSTGSPTGSVFWPSPTVTFVDDRTRRILFHGTGRYLLHVQDRHDVMQAAAYREVWIGARDAADPNVSAPLQYAFPKLSAALEGTMEDFTADQDYSHHGIAGPRYHLRARAIEGQPLGWSFIGFVPPRVFTDGPSSDSDDGAENAFRIPFLAPGEYLWHDHLREDRMLTRRGGVAGGRPVSLGAGELNSMGEVAADGARDVHLKVRSRGGSPVSAATLQYVDAMADSREAFMRIPTTATFAEYPIPPPFRMRLNEDGTCVMPNVRRGDITLRLRLDHGAEHSTTLNVEGYGPEGDSVVWTID